MDKFRIGAAVAVLVNVLAFLGYLVHEHADPTMMAALATVAGAAITAVVHYIARTSDNSKGPPAGPLAVVLGVSTILAASSLIGCDKQQEQRIEAAGAYGNDDLQCVADAPKLARDAGVDERRKAWAAFDDCVTRVHQKWDIAESPFAAKKDGGQ